MISLTSTERAAWPSLPLGAWAGLRLGSALVADGLLMPLELAHLPYRRGRTYEDYVGVRGFMRLGRSRSSLGSARALRSSLLSIVLHD